MRKSAKCIHSAHGLTVGWIYQIQRDIFFRYLICNDEGIMVWYATDRFEEVK
jgi:hypothetical protein